MRAVPTVKECWAKKKNIYNEILFGKLGPVRIKFLYFTLTNIYLYIGTTPDILLL